MHRLRGPALALIVSGFAASAVVVLFVVPVPTHFALAEVAITDLTPCTGVEIPAGAMVHFSWQARAPVDFYASSCSAHLIEYSANGTGGSGAFSAAGGVYEFGSACIGDETTPCVLSNVTGYYSHPLLSL